MSKTDLSRRSFLGLGAAAAVAAGVGLAGCSSPTTDAGAETKPAESTSTTAPETASNDWLGKAPEIAESDIIETIDTEVLVIGAGTGGMFAACSAAEEGAKVVVMEKQPVGGGIRDNLGSIGSRLQKEFGADAEIDELEFLNDLMRYSSNNCNPLLYKIWMENSGEAVDWYQDRVEERGYELFYEGDTKHLQTRYKHWPTGHIPSWPADA